MKRRFAFAAVLLASAAPLPASVMLTPAPAFAQAALTFENISLKGSIGTLVIPKITIEGSNATRADIEGLFNPANTATVAERFQRLNARSISIPVIEFRQTTNGVEAVTYYRDTVMRDVRNGVIGHSLTPVSTSRSKVPDTGAKGSIDMDFRAADMVLKDFDLGLMLRAVFGKGAPNEPMKVAAAEQSIGRMSMTMGKDMTMTIANIAMRDFRMRALERPLIDIFAETTANAEKKEPGWDKKNMALTGSVMSAFGLGSIEMNGLVTETRDGAKPPVKVAFDKIAMSSATLFPERFSMQGMRVAAEGSTVNIGEVTLDGIDASAAVGAIMNSELGGDPAALVPKFSLIRFAGIDFDMPDGKAKDTRVKLKLDLFETTMSNHVGAIPANVAMTLDRLQMTIPPKTSEAGLKELLALGYSSLNVSGRYDQVWDESTKTLKLNDFTLNAPDMVSAKITAEVGNVARGLFNTDRAIAAVAMLGVNARKLDAEIVNNGLFQKLLAKQANDSKRKPEEIRAELAAGAMLVVPMLLGDHPGGKLLGEVLGKFVADPKNIKLSLTAQGEGLGVTDFMAAGNPTDLLQKVDIKASANE
jgi:hypothetical protein